MKRKVWVAFILALLLILVGCGAGSRNEAALPEDGASSDYNSAPREPAAPPGEVGRDSQDGSLAGADQKLIYNASLALDTEDIEAASAEIGRIARQAGGFVAKSNIFSTERRHAAEFMLRIPAERLSDVLEEIRILGDVRRDTLDSDDVTMQYVDLEARIRNLQRQEERLLEILDQAETVEDILHVEQELARIRGDLEARTAEFRYLRDRVNYASVSVSLEESFASSTTVDATGLKGVWQRGVGKLVSSVNSLLTGVGDFIVFLFSALPYLLLFAVIGTAAYFIYRKINNIRTRS